MKHKRKLTASSECNSLMQKKRIRNEATANNIHPLNTKTGNSSHKGAARHHFNQKPSYKLPILTKIELISENACTPINSAAVLSDPNRTVLFQDYLLVQSDTKYKHLLHTVFEQVELPNKQDYQLVDGT